ncbi:MAG TPA: hypothetical protein VFP80_11860 [Thermoanaerobaculia bacterium]|nr:hypothetical protein [Thermoanaerobaculia bacterium]
MSNAMAVARPIPVATTNLDVVAPNALSVTVLVTADSNGDNEKVFTSPTYLAVPVPATEDEGKAVMITWTIDSTLNVKFDTPGITILSSAANVLYLPPSADGLSASILWRASEPGRSFSYRINLLKIMTTAGVMERKVLIDDPVIHNDPPTVS